MPNLENKKRFNKEKKAATATSGELLSPVDDASRQRKMSLGEAKRIIGGSDDVYREGLRLDDGGVHLSDE